MRGNHTDRDKEKDKDKDKILMKDVNESMRDQDIKVVIGEKRRDRMRRDQSSDASFIIV